MYRWLLVLLIALLPLRGWVGDAMAGQMLEQRLATVAAGAQAHGGAGAPMHPMPPMHHAGAAAGPAMHDDCAGHAIAPAGVAAAVPPEAGAPASDLNLASEWQSDCPTCASCQVCSAVALLLPAAPPVAAPALSQPRPHGLPRLGLSAERAGLFKPPIS